jgi:hypothetical protein
MATIESAGEASLAPTAPRVTVRGAELEVALGEVDAVLAAAPAGDYRDRLVALRAELVGDGPLDEGTAEPEGLGPDSIFELDRLIELALQSGRLRAVYGPGGEAAATRLYRRLPSGRELTSSAREVNEALRTLSGQVLDDVALSVNGPGAFGLVLSVGGREITVRLDRQGVRLHAVGV